MRYQHRRDETPDFSRYPAGRRRAARPWCALAALGLAIAGTAARADNPGYDRPGIGFTPAVLGAGAVTWEQGLPDWSRAEDGTRYGADTLLRLGLGGPFELQLGGSPYDYARDGDQHWQGRGDSTLGFKFAGPAQGPLSWGLLGSVEFTDGDAMFRADRRQYLLGVQSNVQLDARHSLGLYLEDVHAGPADQTTVALSDSYALDPTLGLYAEAAWLHLPGQGHGTEAGAGLAWQVHPRVQLDAGLDRRLGGAAPSWQANLGVSIYFGH